jgi:hypothetical protein
MLSFYVLYRLCYCCSCLYLSYRLYRLHCLYHSNCLYGLRASLPPRVTAISPSTGYGRLSLPTGCGRLFVFTGCERLCSSTGYGHCYPSTGCGRFHSCYLLYIYYKLLSLKHSYLFLLILLIYLLSPLHLFFQSF